MNSEISLIAVLEGDGIGAEIMAEAIKVLRAVQGDTGQFVLEYAPFGGQSYFEHGAAFPLLTQDLCDRAQAVLKGPIGLSHEESQRIPVDQQPERAGLLPLRKRYETYANFRPVYLPAELTDFSPLKPEIVKDGIDIMMIRELVGGLYFGEKKVGRDAFGQRFVQEMLAYNEAQIRQVAHIAFQEAQRRKGVLHNIHKSNVLKSSVLWNEVVTEVAEEYPQVTVKNMIVDATATALVLNPCQFDVMLMENMFGDILSDLGGGVLGSLGLMPSASIGLEKAIYEPSHGSAPDIAGQGIANPYSMIGSMALMLDKTFHLPNVAQRIWQALRTVFAQGYTTRDLGGGTRKVVGTCEFGDLVVEALEAQR